MKRKTAIKELMSIGFDRNGAEHILDSYQYFYPNGAISNDAIVALEYLIPFHDADEQCDPD